MSFNPNDMPNKTIDLSGIIRERAAHYLSTAPRPPQTEWEQLAQLLLSGNPIGIMETHTDGTSSIFAKVTGYTEDQIFGRLLRIERVDEKGLPVIMPAVEKVPTLEKGEGIPEKVEGGP